MHPYWKTILPTIFVHYTQNLPPDILNLLGHLELR
jgi:hypothetical protein